MTDHFPKKSSRAVTNAIASILSRLACYGCATRVASTRTRASLLLLIERLAGANPDRLMPVSPDFVLAGTVAFLALPDLIAKADAYDRLAAVAE